MAASKNLDISLRTTIKNNIGLKTGRVERVWLYTIRFIQISLYVKLELLQGQYRNRATTLGSDHCHPINKS